MTIDQFRERMATGEPIIGGSDLHRKFHQYSQEALRITAEINGSYHTPEELRRLLSELWAIEVPESFGMFPPFYTDCGKNTHVGERVFINMGCKFQDQGGIFIDDDALIGHNATLCTAVSSSTTMLLSVITPHSARSIIFLTRRNGQV